MWTFSKNSKWDFGFFVFCKFSRWREGVMGWIFGPNLDIPRTNQRGTSDLLILCNPWIMNPWFMDPWNGVRVSMDPWILSRLFAASVVWGRNVNFSKQTFPDALTGWVRRAKHSSIINWCKIVPVCLVWGVALPGIWLCVYNLNVFPKSDERRVPVVYVFRLGQA